MGIALDFQMPQNLTIFDFHRITLFQTTFYLVETAPYYIISLFAITPLQVLAIQRKKKKKKRTVKEHTTKYKATKLRTV